MTEIIKGSRELINEFLSKPIEKGLMGFKLKKEINTNIFEKFSKRLDKMKEKYNSIYQIISFKEERYLLVDTRDKKIDNFIYKELIKVDDQVVLVFGQVSPEILLILKTLVK